MNDIEKIKSLVQEKNYNSRKYQYLILAELTGITPEQAKQVCSLQRQIRFAIPADEKGKALAEEWKSPLIAKFTCEANNQFKMSFKQV